MVVAPVPAAVSQKRERERAKEVGKIAGNCLELLESSVPLSQREKLRDQQMGPKTSFPPFFPFSPTEPYVRLIRN